MRYIHSILYIFIYSCIIARVQCSVGINQQLKKYCKTCTQYNGVEPARQFTYASETLLFVHNGMWDHTMMSPLLALNSICEKNNMMSCFTIDASNSKQITMVKSFNLPDGIETNWKFILLQPPYPYSREEKMLNDEQNRNSDPYSDSRYMEWRRGKYIDDVATLLPENILSKLDSILGSNVVVEQFDLKVLEEELPLKVPYVLIASAPKKLSIGLTRIIREIGYSGVVKHLRKSQRSVVKELGIQFFPSIAVLPANSSGEGDTYGLSFTSLAKNVVLFDLTDKFEYGGAARFLHPLLLPKDTEEHDLFRPYPIPEITDADCYRLHCQNSSNYCLIQLSPPTTSPVTRFAHTYELKVLESRSPISSIDYGWMNTTKQPRFVQYFTNNDSKYSDGVKDDVILQINQYKHSYIRYDGEMKITEIWNTLADAIVNNSFHSLQGDDVLSQFTAPSEVDGIPNEYVSSCHNIRRNTYDPDIEQIRKLFEYDDRWDLPFYFNYQTVRGLTVVASFYQDIVGQLIIRNKPYIVRFTTNPNEVNEEGVKAFAEASLALRGAIKFITAICGTDEANDLAPRVWSERLQKNVRVKCTNSIYGSEALHVLFPMDNDVPRIDDVVTKRTSMYIRYQESVTDTKALGLFSNVLIGQRGTHYDSQSHTTPESYCSVISQFNGTTDEDLKFVQRQDILIPHLFIFTDSVCDNEILKTAVEQYNYVKFMTVSKSNQVAKELLKISEGDIRANLFINAYTYKDNVVSTTMDSVRLENIALAHPNLLPVLTESINFFSPPVISKFYANMIDSANATSLKYEDEMSTVADSIDYENLDDTILSGNFNATFDTDINQFSQPDGDADSEQTNSGNTGARDHDEL